MRSVTGRYAPGRSLTKGSFSYGKARKSPRRGIAPFTAPMGLAEFRFFVCRRRMTVTGYLSFLTVWSSARFGMRRIFSATIFPPTPKPRRSFCEAAAFPFSMHRGCRVRPSQARRNRSSSAEPSAMTFPARRSKPCSAEAEGVDRGAPRFLHGGSPAFGVTKERPGTITAPDVSAACMVAPYPSQAAMHPSGYGVIIGEIAGRRPSLRRGIAP